MRALGALLEEPIGGVDSAPAQSLALHARKTTLNLMSRQIRRPNGVRGLFVAVFGEDDDDENLALEKLQHVVRLLCTMPFGIKPKVHESYSIGFHAVS